MADRSLLTPVLSANWDDRQPWTMTGYGDYGAARKALAMEPDAVIQTVKDSGLRGRGGAGFPTGSKWGFIPQGAGNPHVLLEGIVIASYAIRASHAFIYVRGEVLHVVRRLQAAVQEAYDAGVFGSNVLGTGYALEVVVHAGAGAYICGEETALLDSL